MIVNNVNGKTYIGQHKSNNINDSYMGSGAILSKAKRKYGRNAFEKFLLEYVETKEKANEREIFWIEHYRTLGKAEYNISKGGENAFAGWNRGKKMSKNFCLKNSEAHKGQIPWNKGKDSWHPVHNKPHSEETRRKISEAMKGNKNACKKLQ